MVGKRNLQGFLLAAGEWKPNARIVALTLLRMKLRRFFWNFPCDAMSFRKGYKYRAANEGKENLRSANVFESLRSFVRMSSGIESAVTVIISDFLSVCAVFSCFLCYTLHYLLKYVLKRAFFRRKTFPDTFP
ncbi:hypothetical protein AVEN_160781-1 [Araneus ventricosus]|uniref:Uncharacterized protein n=1 Tax=Araneus ventricosus TaxID=182803 RepID=A0A4Y2W3D0_ARAVE|nr:hypothetical protein AVEN_160781-1 [Araneus ventricosus]